MSTLSDLNAAQTPVATAIDAQIADANSAVTSANARADGLQKLLDAANGQHASDQQAIMGLQLAAAQAQAKPAAITVGPTPLPLITLPNLQPSVNRITSPFHITQPGRYDFSQIQFQGTAGPLFLIEADNVWFTGGVYDSIFPATLPSGKNMRVGVDAIICKGRNFVIDHGQWLNIDVGIQLWPHAHGVTLIEPHFEPGKCRAQNVYCGASGQDESIERGDVIWLGGYGKSEQEHPFRSSTPGFSGLYAYGVQFYTDGGKECVAPRRGSRFVFKSCKFNGTIGAQVGETGPSSNACQDVTFDDCDFMGCAYNIDIRAATNVKVLNGRFRSVAYGPQAGQETQIVTGNAQGVTVQNNTRYVPTLTPAGRKLRAIVDPPFVDDGSNKNVVGDGTNTISKP